MKKTLLVKCPLCGGTMEVSAESGKVVQHWTQAASTGGKDLGTQLEKVRERQRRLAATDEGEIARRLEESKKKGESAFDERVRKARKAIDDGERPENPMDLD
ncbi:MAG: hypothetical protein HYZ53_28340 [Planctomycetes bacterium]|nr:hypothetical protein [Planctomycetota bacterium]